MPRPIHDLSLLFKGLSEPIRLRLLNLLCEENVCVCHLTGVLGLAQPIISRHLGYLKKSGLVQARREGKWMHYQWAKQQGAGRDVMDGLRDWMMKDKQMTAERRKLKKTRCS